MYQVNSKKITDLFIELVRISSPSFEEKPIFDYVENYLKGKKLNVERLPYVHGDKHSENMIIRLESTEPNLKSYFFDAHADTVLPCENIQPIIDGDIIRSSGNSILGADDKCGIASMLIAIDMILEQNIPHGDLIFIISSAEEVGLIGASYLPENLFKNVNFGIILDGEGDLGHITVKAPYHYTYTIKITGRAAHAAMAPEKGINAIKLAAKIIEELPSGRISEDTVANIGVIKGGTARNVVPEFAEIVGEVRSIIGENCSALLKQIANTIEKYRAEAIHIDYDLVYNYPGYQFTEEDTLIQIMKKSLEDMGLTAHYEESCGGTNANIYTQKGIQSTVVSVGMQAIHSVDEWIKIQDLVDTTRFILHIIGN